MISLVLFKGTQETNPQELSPTSLPGLFPDKKQDRWARVCRVTGGEHVEMFKME